MPITNHEQMAQALREAEDGTVTLDGILTALQPYQSVMGAMNELFRTIPSQAVLLILSTFAGTIIYDSRLQFPDTEPEGWMELHKRHARVAYETLERTTREDPRMAEYAISRQTHPQADPRDVRLTPKDRRSAFSVLQGGAVPKLPAQMPDGDDNAS